MKPQHCLASIVGEKQTHCHGRKILRESTVVRKKIWKEQQIWILFFSVRILMQSSVAVHKVDRINIMILIHEKTIIGYVRTFSYFMSPIAPGNGPPPKIPSSAAKIIVLDWGDKVNSGIGLSYRPATLLRLAGRFDNPLPESTISPSQGL